MRSYKNLMFRWSFSFEDKNELRSQGMDASGSSGINRSSPIRLA